MVVQIQTAETGKLIVLRFFHQSGFDWIVVNVIRQCPKRRTIFDALGDKPLLPNRSPSDTDALVDDEGDMPLEVLHDFAQIVSLWILMILFPMANLVLAEEFEVLNRRQNCPMEMVWHDHVKKHLQVELATIKLHVLDREQSVGFLSEPRVTRVCVDCNMINDARLIPMRRSHIIHPLVHDLDHADIPCRHRMPTWSDVVVFFIRCR
jgi:hypothetical protein